MERYRILCLVLAAGLWGCGPRTEPAAEQAKQTAASGAAEEAPPVVKGMVWIPSGRFLMGSFGGMPNEQPVHEVQISGFYLDETEVTNAQFRAFVDATGYLTMAEKPMTEDQLAQIPADQRPAKQPVHFGSILFKKTEGPVPLSQPVWWKMDFDANWRHPDGEGSNLDGKENHPVVCVTYEDAAAYSRWAGKRLPSEAEWEYAARGGLAEKKYEWGNSPPPADKGSTPADWPCNIWQGNFPYEDWATDGYSGTAPVRSYKPNGLGLFDMTGNVWEICEDWYGAGYYAQSPSKDPRGPMKSEGAQGGAEAKVMRGASWRIHRSYGPSPQPGAPPILEYRVCTRNEAALDTATNDVGFRCAKSR